MLVAEEAEPRRGDQDEQNGGDPSRPEALVEQRRLAVEVTPRRDEREEHHAEDDRLLEVAAFENLEEDAGAEDDDGELIRGVEAPLQAAREDQQRGAGDRCRRSATARRAAAARRGAANPMRPGSVGVAPEKSSTAPPMNVVKARSCGAMPGAHRPKIRHALTTPSRFSTISCVASEQDRARAAAAGSR